MPTEAPTKTAAAPAAPTPAAPTRTPIPNRAASRFVSVKESLGLGTKKPAAAATPPADVKPPVADPKAAPAPGAPAGAPAAPAPKPEKKGKPAVAPAPTVDTKAISTAVADGVREAMKPTVAAPKDESESLTPELRRKYVVLQRMAKDHPEFESKPKEFIESAKKLAAYRAEWETKNKGGKFNLDDEDHADFLKANDVTWDEDLYIEALADIRADERINGVKKEFDGKLSEVENRERERSSIPKLIQHQATAAKVLFNELGADFEKVLDAAGNINGAEIAALIEKNPDLEDVFPLAEKVEAISGELFRIANRLTSFVLTPPAGATPEQLKTVAVHNEIVHFVTDEERRMSALPEDKRKNEAGLMFAPAEAYSKMTDEEKARHWHFNDSDLSALYAYRQAQTAKSIIEKAKNRFERNVKSRGYKPADSGNPAPDKSRETSPAPTPAKVVEPSPAGVAAPRMAPSPNRQLDDKKPIRAQILGR